jgi:hypothetical protein
MTYDIFVGTWGLLCASVLCVAIVVAYNDITKM